MLCLQELRIQAEEMDAEHSAPAGAHAVQMDAVKKGYAGTAIWSRVPPRAVDRGTGLGWADEEGRLVRMDLPEATVLSAYLPSGSASTPEEKTRKQERKDAFLAHFFELTAGLLREGRPVVIGGDFNIAHREIDIHDPKGNAKNSGFLPHERAWMDALLAQGWVDLFRQLNPDQRAYSWWSNRGRARENDKGWRLDYLVASPDLARRAELAWIDRGAGLSDHAPVLVRFGDADARPATPEPAAASSGSGSPSRRRS